MQRRPLSDGGAVKRSAAQGRERRTRAVSARRRPSLYSGKGQQRREPPGQKGTPGEREAKQKGHRINMRCPSSDWRCHPDSNWGVELLQSSALPLGYGTILYRVCTFAEKYYLGKKRGKEALPRFGASDEARTRYLHLGKVALYQMSYTRIWVPRRENCGGWCLRSESNQRHEDFQSSALPTELQRQKWRRGRDLNPRPPA